MQTLAYKLLHRSPGNLDDCLDLAVNEHAGNELPEVCLVVHDETELAEGIPVRRRIGHFRWLFRDGRSFEFDRIYGGGIETEAGRMPDRSSDAAEVRLRSDLDRLTRHGIRVDLSRPPKAS